MEPPTSHVNGLLPSSSPPTSASVHSMPHFSWTRATLQTFGTTLYLLTGAGIVYGFSAYSTQLRDHLGFTQLQLSTLASTCNLGLYLTGPFVGHLVDTYGPNRIAKLSTVLMFLGFANVTYAYATSHVPNYTYTPFTIALYYFIIGCGSSGVTLSCITLNIKTFNSDNRGFAVGVPLSFYGLSAFLFVQVKSIWFTTLDSGNIYGFLMFITAYMGLSILMAVGNLNDPKQQSQSVEDYHIIADEQVPIPDGIDSTPVLSDHGSAYATLQDFLSHLNNWLLVVTFFLAVGTGLMVIGNIGAVVLSMSPEGSKSSDTHVQVAQVLQVGILSIFNALGRIIAGLGSDYTGSRPWWLFSSLVVMAVACSIVAFGFVPPHTPKSFFLCMSTAMIGYSYGTLWALTPAIVANMIVPIRFGFIWGIMTSVPAISQQLTNTLFGILYDSNRAGANMTAMGEGSVLLHECYGPKCYTQAYTVTTVFCVLGMICSFMLAYYNGRELSGRSGGRDCWLWLFPRQYYSPAL